jgi:hypothetical protein
MTFETDAVDAFLNNVIHVDFRKALGNPEPNLSEREQFLHLLAVELDELDFQDFVEAVNDADAYADLDEDLKDLVDAFFQKAC